MSHNYAIASPASRRRTKSSVWVKLFAVSVTTVGIHGHFESRWIKSIEKKHAFYDVGKTNST